MKVVFKSKVIFNHKGPLKNYVILLGGGLEVTKRLHKITRGRGDSSKDYIGIKAGGINFNPSKDKVSKKI